jgi:hypothetical protein
MLRRRCTPLSYLRDGQEVRRYSPTEDETIVRMRNAGTTLDRIGLSLDPRRSANSVRQRILDLAKHEATENGMADPRWLDRETLARHIAVRVDHIPRLQKAGKLPEPSLHLGPRCPRWDREAVDAMFGGGVASCDAEAAAQAVINRILAGEASPRR